MGRSRFLVAVAFVSVLMWSVLAGNGVVTAATPDRTDVAGSRGAPPAEVSVKLHERTLQAGVTRRYCFHFSAYIDAGAMVATASATTADVVLTMVSTDLERRTGLGWVYCATVKNSSAVGSTFTLDARATIPAEHAYNSWVGTLAAGATKSFCFPIDPAGWFGGPLVVSAASNHADVILTTVSTTAKENKVIGSGATATYCAAIRNASLTSTEVKMQGSVGLYGGWFSQPAGTLAPDTSGRACYLSSATAVPFAASAESTQIGTVTFTTVSTDREFRSGAGWFNCATLHLSASAVAVQVNFEAVDTL
jgi:hypothetical protein